jgi:hypothetical protein
LKFEGGWELDRESVEVWLSAHFLSPIKDVTEEAMEIGKRGKWMGLGEKEDVPSRPLQNSIDTSLSFKLTA